MDIHTYLTRDHGRLDALLRKAVEGRDTIDLEPYSQFRQGLLRHIGIEEKIVLPAIVRFQNGRQAEISRRLRLDHGALVALLVPPPSKGIIDTIRIILSEHNPLEENEGGLYELVQRLAGGEADELLEKIESFPEVPSLPFNDRPEILDVTRRAVERAGYKPEF